MPPSLKRSLSGSESPEREREYENERAKKSRKVVEDDREDQSDYEDIEVNLGVSSDEQESLTATQLSQKTNIAQAGTVERVEVVNFMCHHYLRVDFLPKMNFVIGHNGSGKSAILTAITVALGAKANSTNRGKRLSSLIREGANAALVTVYISNKGPDAYRHDAYGDSIRIERKILQDGVGNYRIKNVSGAVISHKREELTAILDHHSLRIDNPLTILSQDNAREFLNSSTPSEKYRLFMRGTQLAQLMEDYTIVRESLDITDAIVSRKRQCLPELHQRALDARERYNQAQKLGKLEEEIDDLNMEHQWAQVIGKEKEVIRGRENVVAAEKLVDFAEQDLAIKREQVGRFDEDIAALEENIDAGTTSGGSNLQEQALLENAAVDLKAKQSDIKADITEVNQNVKATKIVVQKHEQELEKRKAEEAANTQSVRDALRAKVTELNNEKTALETDVNQCKTELTNLDNQKKEKETERTNITKESDRIQQRLRAIQKEINDLRGQKSNRLRAFGQNVPEVLGDIDAERDWRRKPVGPLGRYVKLKYAEYAETMEVVLGKLLNAFVVDNYDDRRKLMNILERRRMGGTIVLVSRYDLFNYTDGEPDDKYLTMLRALDIEDEWVKRQLIIARGIEKTLLIADREEANRVMENGGPRNVRACFTARAQKIGARRGMRVEALDKYKGPPRFKKDIDPEINEAESELRRLNTESEAAKERKRTIDEQLTTLRGKIQRLNSNRTNAEIRLRRVCFDIRSTEENIQEEEPATINMLNEEINTQNDKIANYALQFQGLMREYKEVGKQLKDNQDKLHQLQAKDSERIAQVDVLKERKRALEDKKQRATAVFSSVQDKYNTQVVRRNEAIHKLKELEATVKQWTRTVISEFPVRMETDRRPEVIQREIDKLEISLKERNDALGNSVEETERQAAEALRVYDDAKRSIRMMDGLRTVMKKALDHRMDQWSAFRMYIALAAKAHFTYYMHKRGDNGNLKFRHDTEKLHIRVSTADQFKKGSRHKDSKSLSGGEKSFSQISLLLSMWQGIASPLVCLDEFDVYMDAVNRQQCLRMLMDSAQEHSETQYILITPQDATFIKPGPFVAINRLNDPQRQQIDNE